MMTVLRGVVLGRNGFFGEHFLFDEGSDGGIIKA